MTSAPTNSRRGNHEGSRPIQRRDGRWQIALRYIDVDGTAKRTTITGKTQKAVRDQAKDVRARLDKKQPPKDTKRTLGVFVTEWATSTLEASNLKESTRSLYKTLATKHIVNNAIGSVSLDRLTPRRIEAWTVELRSAGLADSTRRSAFHVLRAILDTAVRDSALAINPAHVVKRPRVAHQEAAYLSPDQVRALLVAAESSRYGDLFALMVNTGLRRGEALALHWTDVDHVHGLLWVRGTLARVGGELTVTDPKTDKSRRPVPMSAAVDSLLRDVRAHQRQERVRAGSQWRDSGHVFTTELGAPCDPRNALRALKAAAKKAGLPGDVGLHTLRHSAASTMLANGVPLKVVSEILGHSSVAITGDIYGHVAPEVASSAVSVLSSALA